MSSPSNYNNALTRVSDASAADIPSIEVRAPYVASGLSSINERKVEELKESFPHITIEPPKSDRFTCFGRLPVELRVKIIDIAARAPRHNSISLRWHPRPAHDGDTQGLALSREYRPRATFIPAKNYAVFLQVNREFRFEILGCLKILEFVPNPCPKQDYHPSDVYVNWESDIMVLDYIHVGYHWIIEMFMRPLFDVVSAQEREKIQRLIVPMICKDFFFNRMDDIRQNFPGLKEFCLLDRPKDVASCEYLSNTTGNPKVLVDVSEFEMDDGIGLSHCKLGQLKDQFALVKKTHPEWKLEKLRLVIWAQNK